MAYFDTCFYQICFIDYGKKCEVRVYPKAIMAPGYGLPPERRPRYQDGEWLENPFDLNQYGEPRDVFVLSEEEILMNEEYNRKKSVNRSKNKIYALAQGYAWEYFLTFTFSSAVIDRYSYPAVVSAMSSWLHALRRKQPEAMYIIVPEQHQDGAYHFHGLFAQCDLSLSPAAVPGVYNVQSFPYGFTTATPVKDQQAICRYITKYVTKEIASVAKGKRRYWHSSNVRAPEKQRVRIHWSDVDMLDGVLHDGADYVSTVDSPGGPIRYFHFDEGIPDDLREYFNAYDINNK